MSKIKDFTSGIFDIGAEAAILGYIGYGCGHFINHVVQILKPSFFSKAVFVIPFNGAVCCGIFSIVDLFAQSIFEKMTFFQSSHRSLSSVVRIAVCIPIAALLTAGEELLITIPAAFAVVICSLAVYVAILQIAKLYDERKLRMV